MLFYELDIRVWDNHQELTFEEFHSEVIYEKNVEKKLDNFRLICLVLWVAVVNNVVFSAPTLPCTNDIQSGCDSTNQVLNIKYPLTDPILSLKYRIAIISDLDSGSVSQNESNTWLSYFKQGYLTYNPDSNNITIEWDPENRSKIFKSHLSMNGRGLELSELVTYNGQLITLDDKTGLVYVIDGDMLIPWVLLVEGDGHQVQGMKNEWATVKDSELYVGSHGQERVTPDGPQPVSLVNMWVKVIDRNGAVRHLNWTENYIKVRAAFGIHFPGYMTHESCVWSDVHGLWFFLPRKASVDPYSDEADERRATNVLLAATPDFDDIKVTRIGEIVPNHGYASFKFIPGTNDTIITAIKTMEEGNASATYITAFTIKGEIIYPETKVCDLKFEGFEFI